MPKKCHECNASVSDDDLFCSRCGTLLGRSKSVPEEDVISAARAVAHSLNNALSIALTNSQLAMHEIADLPEEISERMKNHLQDIASAATDSGAVVHQFQKFLHSLAGGHSQEERSAYVDFMSFLEKETQADKAHATGKFTMSRPQVLDAGPKGKNIIATQERVGRISLLIVDDEDKIRHALSYALTLAGYHVMTAPDGLEALTLLQNGSYDIAFVDLKMPGMDGWTLARAIKKMEPRIKIVLMTGFRIQMSDEGAKASYIDAVITKPFDLSEIISLIATVMDDGI